MSTLLAAALLCGCRSMTEKTTVTLLPSHRNGDAQQVETKGDPFLATEPPVSPSPNVVEFVDDEASQGVWD